MFGGVFEELQRADGVLDGHEEERRLRLRLDEIRHQLVLVDLCLGLEGLQYYFDLIFRFITSFLVSYSIFIIIRISILVYLNILDSKN